ncbi:hypothetical protein PY093_03335 [Cytobacillus sp. S13-E01]|uniref:hypothetical protein n=1 Tax=Cytobacillus sp. S13-E01 TaxID=3031326 RepID=UPI0023D7FA01|nr:hypothetical protein [Cytobacillus sp. S13-E01]MDF0725746.1 hypothetical protein [Cytobacillus sp. S13-E01]
MYGYRNWSIRPEIGTAWYGRHVVIIRCNPYLNKFLEIAKSLHAPTELPNENCAETLAQYFSIGYELLEVTAISQNEVLYILRK